MKKILKYIYIFIALSLPLSSFAQNNVITATIENPLQGTNSIFGLVAKVLEFVVKIGTVIVVFAIIWTGFLFIKAQGAPDKIKEAKNAFMWTVIGGVILIGAQVLSGVICNTTRELGANVQCSQLIGSPLFGPGF